MRQAVAAGVPIAGDRGSKPKKGELKMKFYNGPKMDYYCGLSIVLPRDDRFFAQSLAPAIDVVDVGRLGLCVGGSTKICYWGLTIHQFGVAVAVVRMAVSGALIGD